jgi:hypothetical protein
LVASQPFAYPELGHHGAESRPGSGRDPEKSKKANEINISGGSVRHYSLILLDYFGFK